MATDDGSVRERPKLSEIQRARILRALIEVVAEHGFAGASVALVARRAKVSRRTFHECFDGLDDGLVAVLDGALARAAPLVARAFTGGGAWQDGMRAALAEMLEFFDEEPELARVCLVEMQTAGPVVREHRERILAAFRALVVARIESEVSHASPLAAEGAHASVVGIVNARLIARERGPLIELLGPLMGIIAGPFMDGAQVAQEIEKGNDLARELLARRSPRDARGGDMVVEVPDVLLTKRAHRARECLLYVAENPGVSNQQVAVGIGVLRREQVSRLLGKLAGLGLLVKYSGGPGRPNAWLPSTAGERVSLALTENNGDTSQTW